MLRIPPEGPGPCGTPAGRRMPVPHASPTALALEKQSFVFLRKNVIVFLEVLSVPGVPLLNNGLALRCPHLLDS